MKNSTNQTKTNPKEAKTKMSTQYWNKRKTRQTKMPNNYDTPTHAAKQDFTGLYAGAKRIANQPH